uniref:ARAD1C29810p n=1 Tax=Blastobotrys adeninivorans TaxID=409370 RepID=A0A060T2A6_BLAAD
MKASLVFTLAGLVNAHGIGSFLDEAFGLFDYISEGSTDDAPEPVVIKQDDAHSGLEDYQDGFVKIPSKDYIDDLESGPLYAGVVTFAHMPQADCVGYHHQDERFDIAIVGAPFDTGVSYRPGARFGPSGIREGSRRMSPGQYGAYRPDLDQLSALKVVECGDIAMTPFDNRVALDQLYRGERAILKHKSATTKEEHPRIITLGGDHTITFSALRAVHEVHGPVSVIHFDSHIDTWTPETLGGNISSYQGLNHGTFLHWAHEKGYLSDTNMHVGSRAPYTNKGGDLENDHRCGFDIVLAREIDSIGVQGIVNKIRDRVGDGKVYISVDIDVLDPAYAPGTGTAEPGGFTTREFLEILDGLEGINIVGGDVVEVAPSYDTNGGITALAAAEVVNSLIGLMVLS